MATLVGRPSGHMQINTADSALASAEIKPAQAHSAMPNIRRACRIGHPSALSRVSVPQRVTSGGYAELASLDPARGSVVEGWTKTLTQQQPSELTVTGYREDFYQIRYSAAADTLIRIAVPFAPGWRAAVDGMPVAVLPVDYALSGVLVPAGQHQLTLEFRPKYFLVGAALSIATAIGVILLSLW